MHAPQALDNLTVPARPVPRVAAPTTGSGAQAARARYLQQLRHAAPWVLLIGLLLAAWHHYVLIGTNFVTKSLPDHVFVTLKQQRVLDRGDYVTFTWSGGGPYPRGMRFTKIVAGMPGDVVTAEGPNYYINGRLVATAKPVSKTGHPLKPGPVGVIPAGHYFVVATHPDSLDSRYAMTGWVRDEQVIGRAVPLF